VEEEAADESCCLLVAFSMATVLSTPLDLLHLLQNHEPWGTPLSGGEAHSGWHAFGQLI